ncbi:hypothetical protein WMY93_000414 [Mugilogobius chulae]|uniref:C1q domain-containing protein n=1 Tax=Mugilogobius chulae TaxID=88201 RepID=A0AAW0PYW6_9GOBI
MSSNLSSKNPFLYLVYLRIPLCTDLQTDNAKMLLRLLGLLVLSTLCSSLAPPHLKTRAPGQHPELDRGRELRKGSSSGRHQRSGPGNERGCGSVCFGADRQHSSRRGDVSGHFHLRRPVQLLGSHLHRPDPVLLSLRALQDHTGVKGERGDTGETGPTGSPGRRGLMGFKGPRGFTGAPGHKGEYGDQGDKGQPGAIGLTGVKGESGFKGEKGDIGDDGSAGPLGPQGVSGSCHCDIVIGPPGTQGSPGPAGARGLPGSKGSKGLPGDKGDKGNDGLAGKTGLDGLKGCRRTERASGREGEKGDIGEQGEQGDTGLRGEMGEMGWPGLPGPCTLAPQSAFSVALTTSFPEPNKPVKFTHIISNVQDHYNPSMGIYITPVNGTYRFSFSLLVKDKRLVAGLFVDFNPVVKMTGNTDYKTVSQEIVLHLNANSMVWVQIKNTDSNGMNAGEEMSSTFSGWLLSPDSCDLFSSRDYTSPTIPPIGTFFEWI